MFAERSANLNPVLRKEFATGTLLHRLVLGMLAPGSERLGGSNFTTDTLSPVFRSAVRAEYHDDHAGNCRTFRAGWDRPQAA